MMSDYIDSCLQKLTDDQVWSRGAPHENSIGNLVLHLQGNVRQWIVSGVGGEQDIRNRDSEFAAQGGLNVPQLRSQLKETVRSAVDTIASTTPERLVAQIHPQSRTVSALEAIYQAVGHFQQHTGQIIFATKILSGEDLGLYRP
jgi:hypothetical protein